MSSPYEDGTPAPAPAPRPVLKGPKLPPPLPPVRQVVMQAATSWKRRNGDWRQRTRFVVDGEPAEALVPAVVAVATREAEPPKLPIMPPIVSAVDTAAVAARVESPAEELPVEAEAAEGPMNAAPVAELTSEAPEAEAPIAEPEVAPVPTPEVATPSEPAQVAAAPVEMAAAVPAAPRATSAPLDGADLGEWDVLLLAGPVGAGKSSVTRRLTELLPHGAYVQLEPMRDKNFTSLVGEIVRPCTGDTAPTLELWSGQTTAARPKAVETAKAFVERGLRVVLDDMIETVADLRGYQQELDGLRIGVVTLMPSVEELELRDKLRPQDQQFGKRVADYRAGMVRQLSEHAAVIDTSTGTTEDIVERILAALNA